MSSSLIAAKLVEPPVCSCIIVFSFVQFVVEGHQGRFPQTFSIVMPLPVMCSYAVEVI